MSGQSRTKVNSSAATAIAIFALVASMFTPAASAAETLDEPASSPAVVASPPVVLPAGSHRLGGTDRYETAAKVSQFAYPDGADTVLIANGLDFPDALSGAPLASKLRAPLLMTRPNDLPNFTVAELKRLNPERVIILGQTGAVSKNVASKLTALSATVERIGGADRYSTSRLIAEYGWSQSATDEAMIATGTNFPDALAAASAAAKIDAPVLLVPAAVNSAVTTTEKTLRNIGVTSLHVAGGTAVVSNSVVNSLNKPFTRYAGSDRYETASKFVETFFSEASGFFWANGLSFPDALSGVAAAGAAGAALGLSPQECAAKVVAAQFDRLSAPTTVALGGTAVLSNNAAKGLRCFDTAPKPKLSGTAKVGSSLTVSTGTWAPKPTALSVQWLRSGKTIAGATSSTYKLVAADKGKVISARVTPQLKGYAPTSRVSNSSGTVYDSASISDPNSIYVVVNKKRPLNPKSFVPTDLRTPRVATTNGHPLKSVAATALEKMFAGAANSGYSLYLSSGYRSYELQRSLYNGYVATYGQVWADGQSARPGYSEHQTGLAADIYSYGYCTGACFGGTAPGQWLRNNAHKYGFILRYDSGMKGTVGYDYEPWHFRYVGVEIASEMRSRKITSLESYFGLGKAPTY